MSELPISSQELARLMRLAQSDAGKQLIRYLKKNNGPALRSAMDQAAAGNYETAREMARELLSSPDIRALLDQLGR